MGQRATTDRPSNRKSDSTATRSPAPNTKVEGGLEFPQSYRDLLEAYSRQEREIQKRSVQLATVAHELKTPLSIVAGYVELLAGGKPGPLNDRQRAILTDTAANCVRLQKFIQDFLEHSRIEAGSASLTFELGDINACLSELCGYWTDRFHSRGVALYFPANPNLKPFEFDYFKIQHIASNLLDNALKFTPAGGTVWVTAEPYAWNRRSRNTGKPELERRTTAATNCNAVRVTVADTGPGIAPEYHLDIFEEFVSLGSSASGQGVGLGLAIARRIVQMHGGKIWVESELGSGSSFCFLLPLKPNAPRGEDLGERH